MEVSGSRVGLHGSALPASFSLHGKQLTKNWIGQGESDCLIKTKHCDWS